MPSSKTAASSLTDPKPSPPSKSSAATSTALSQLGTRRGIIHRDVKTTNILLDRDWVAKISDFGLCKEGTTCHSHTHVSTDVKATIGYLDPEYFLTRRLTKKSNVYAFGVVLLEVLCGRPAVDLSVEEEQRSLAMWAQQCIKEEKHDQLIDPSLRDHISPQCLKVFTEVANKCLHKHPSGRPTMTDVVASLECMLASLEQPRNACTEEEEDEEEDVNVNGDSDQQIYDDKNTQQNDILPQSTVASPSIPVQYNENTQGQKRSKKNLFQRGVAFLARSIDIRSMKILDIEIQTTGADKISDIEIQTNTANEILDVEIQTTAANEIIFQGMSPTTNTTPSNESNISGNWRILRSPTLRIFSFSELRYATRYFSPNRLLGEGRFGKVYRGRVDEKLTSYNVIGFDVAVKKVDYQRIQRFKDWQKSLVGFLGGLSHSNLVKLLGYCWEDEELLLVYEFMPEGSLEKHLLGWNSPVLPWSIRLKILIGAARGLAFLHTSEKPVICKAFKTSNLLLDGSFNSKISDFGYADLDYPESSCGYVPTVWPGTVSPGTYLYEPYIAPEYVATGHLDVRSDVYSFGVVLLEMLTGLCAYDTNHPTCQHNLVVWVQPYLDSTRKLARVMDSRLEGEYPPKAAQQLALLAQQCLGYDPERRPSMEQVAGTLERINLLSSTTAGKEEFKARATDKRKD
ncbi:hypothetical protein Vadar_027663 [Vaccinium darrowii]|uniref:Uncharacterized protein n=1 Tax=Vaccinium darrowii TaxID=229202 RepID=A0ACB7ZM04_9ERIC|nr:hypothetical protein Vadar_027663 [Vaccinium darrowii]